MYHLITAVCHKMFMPSPHLFFLFFFTFFFFQKEAIQNKIKLDNAKASAAAKPPVVLVQPVTESVFLTELS